MPGPNKNKRKPKKSTASKAKAPKTPTKKKKEAKKKKPKKEDLTSSSSSASVSSKSRVQSARATSRVQVVLPNAKEKPTMPGAVFLRHPPTYLNQILQDDRADLAFSEKLSPTEADCLDKHLKDHAELATGDQMTIEVENGAVIYEIQSKYNEGRYSALYIVTRNAWTGGRQTEDNGIYMLKTQLRKSSTRSPLLIKREYTALRAVQNKKKKFTPSVVDFGRVCDMPFLVITLLDRSIEKFRADNGPLSFPTALFVAKEALSALEEVHSKQYVFRDLKPANLGFGIGKEANRVFLMDFGDAVKTGKVIKLGVVDGFTLPYWSLDCHKRAKVSFKTDLEAWLYLLIDLAQPECVPWKGNLNVEEVVKAKEAFWKQYQSTVNEPSFIRLAEMVDSGKQPTSKTYAKMRDILNETMARHLNGADFVLDWMKN